jgi:hypothetical protein
MRFMKSREFRLVRAADRSEMKLSVRTRALQDERTQAYVTGRIG